MNNLFDVTLNPIAGGGIFSKLQSLDPPWADENIALDLDIIYYGNVSGSKITSPLVDRYIENGYITNAGMSSLAAALMAVNSERWGREWATLSAEYDPIANYDMTEIMTDDESVTEYGRQHTRTDNLQHSDTRNDNLTHIRDVTETETPGVTTTDQDYVRAFNSSNDVTTGKRTQNQSGVNQRGIDEQLRDQGTVTNTGSNTGTQRDDDSGSDVTTRNYELTRRGNIGVTTSQQMLSSERDLWMWNYFYDVVFPDIDKMLTSPIYSDMPFMVGAGGGITPAGTIAINENGSYNVAEFARANVNVANKPLFDFQFSGDTGSLVDKIHGHTCETNGVLDPNGKGIHIFDHVYVLYSMVLFRSMAVEIEIGDVITPDNIPGESFIFNTPVNRGLVYRTDLGQGEWYFLSNVPEPMGINDYDFFANSIIKIVVDPDLYVHIYKNGTLVYESQYKIPIQGYALIDDPYIGCDPSYSYQSYNCYIKSYKEYTI